MTSIFTMDDPKALAAAREVLEAGLPVGLPTDTVYVLAVDPFAAGASDRLFVLMRRPRDRDLSVLVATLHQAFGLTTALTNAARRLMEQLWPGPLTLVLPRHPELTADLGDDDLTVGVRMPGHPVPVALCKEIGPLGVATAADDDGALEAAEEVAEAFGDSVPVVIDGGRCAGLPSTVVDATGEEPHLIREGRLPWAEAEAAITN